MIIDGTNAINNITNWNWTTYCYLNSEIFKNPVTFLELVPLMLLNISVLFGNGLVITAILVTKRLRTLTGYLITSLAVADLLIGLTVLPFSIVKQVYENQWMFGRVWCQIWLAVDVWLCTASIYNLTAISIDRFVAIVKPLLYPSIITPKRGKILICATWVSSFVICLPPIIAHWPKIFSSTVPPKDMCTCTPLHNSSGYIIYSALSSFHLPMIIIITLYLRIYWTVRRATKSLVSGYISMNKCDDDSNQLRINKSGSVAVANKEEFLSQNSCESTVASGSPKMGGQKGSPTTQRLLRKINKECFNVVTLTVIATNDLPSTEDGPNDDTWSAIFANQQDTTSQTSTYVEKFRLSFKKYQRKMRLEIRAAKTVAIVTGCFIFCWFGFSVIYLLKAFPWCQRDCIPDVLVNICFWLGYANSALNPFLYALFNKEFRSAFRSLLYCIPMNPIPRTTVSST